MPLSRYIACLLLAWLPAAHAHAQAPSYVGEWSAPGQPWSIATGPDGNLWVSIYEANEVRKYAPDGTLLSTLPSGDGYGHPLGVAFGPGGEIYVSDYSYVRIRQHTSDGTFVSQLSVWTDADSRGAGIAVMPTGYPGSGTVYATNMTGRVLIFCNDPLEACGMLHYNLDLVKTFRGIVADETDRTLFVADLVGGRIYHLRPFGLHIGDWPCGGGPNHIALDQAGRLWISRDAHDIRVFSKDGTHLFSFGQAGTGPGQFNMPSGVAIGQDGNIYVADRMNNRVQIFGYVVPTRPSSWGRLKTTYRGSPGPVP